MRQLALLLITLGVILFIYGWLNKRCLRQLDQETTQARLLFNIKRLWGWSMIIFCAFALLCLFPRYLVNYYHHLYKTNIMWLVNITMTTLSILATLLGIIITRLAENKNRMREEISWWNDLFALETQHSYTLADVIKFNAYLNISRAKEYQLDRIIEQHLVALLHHYQPGNEKCVYDFKELKLTQPLTFADSQQLRKWIHALLQRDWDINTKFIWK